MTEVAMNQLSFTDWCAEVRRICNLSPGDLKLLWDALMSGIPVIIDGTRNVPTGKSRLCAFLRGLGANATETYEFEELGSSHPSSLGSNTTFMTVHLSERIDQSRSDTESGN